ncbi:SPOR domain-containing protein [Polynucleobacter asymbioticus]|uniref:Sporulation protein n=1 Tax=Polynucleobacter asymbioticus TaxID=576611 RepID=A0AAC9ISA2_9BURK|nr:SPOR domain-containing protein [Polynucleobacter asymbioticus]APB98678.1 sporulation protein [Polynucleobacter asymbioticus]APC00965.1 sporulation protein [Polynucleobacter asymbioticus]
MIRLPSFFKRKTQANDLELGSVRDRRTAKKVSPKPSPRSFQRAAEAEELALTEDPEQQRARHRLIGAAVLVLIAVIGLPRILDSKPKPVTNDIAVNIVTSLPVPSADVKPEVRPEEKPKADVPIEAPKAAVLPTPEVKSEAKPEVKAEVKTETKTEAKPTSAPSKTSGLGLAAGEEVVASAAVKPKADDTARKKSVSTGSGKFVIQIGAFASEERAKGWVSKLKDQKIPNYVLTKTGTDGTKLYVLRAGPYTDKDAAEVAEKKIKAMGLSPRLVETGKQ